MILPWVPEKRERQESLGYSVPADSFLKTRDGTVNALLTPNRARAPRSTMRITTKGIQPFLFVVLLFGICTCNGGVQAEPKADLHLEVLKVGTQVYSNVTVTTRAPEYLFIEHSTGLTSVKVADLDEKTLTALGYTVKKKVTVSSTSDWAKREFAKLEPSGTNLATVLPPQLLEHWSKARTVPRFGIQAMAIAAAVILGIHLFFSYCALRICKNAGTEPDFLVWLPAFQLLPLLSAANMSRWWFFGFFVPILNFVAAILWAVKIVKPCGKGTLTTIFLILPITNLLAFLYLAFSSRKGAAASAKRPRGSEIMTLEAT